MTALAEMGAVIAPPVPGLHRNPQTLTDIVDRSLEGILDLLGLADEDARRREGIRR
jgi:4-hydroxy-3-polyprenylbenzoate decarboxylase